jgi:hypothetical protein
MISFIIGNDSTPLSRTRRNNMFLKIESGQQFVSNSPDGPWITREIPESRQRRPRKKYPPQKEKPVMSKSGFDRALEEKERRRRRKLREAEVRDVDPDTPEGFARILSGEVDLPAPGRDTASLQWFLEQYGE